MRETINQGTDVDGSFRVDQFAQNDESGTCFVPVPKLPSSAKVQIRPRKIKKLFRSA
jgi:hypothetical protein